MKYVVLFPECKNVHLLKDVGMIPYYMYKMYDMDACVACYKNELEYAHLEKEVKGLKIEFIEKKFGNARLDGINYIIKNAKHIDILQIFHIHSSRNYYWIDIYKKCNPNGKVYLKLDTNFGLINHDVTFGKGVLKKWRISTLKKCSLISAETESTAYGLSKKWGVRIDWVNNGFYSENESIISYDKKENIICTVGRIGTYQKNTEVLLEAFEIFAKNNSEWILKIIGPVEPEFNLYISEFLNRNPDLNDRIIFTGEIYDRKIIYNEYEKAKIFVMTSRWEGFAISYIEALSAGCYIISSDVYCAYDITDYQKYGMLFSIGDIIGLSKCLMRACNDESILKQTCKNAPTFVENNYEWEKNCKKIYDLLEI